jgi:predicted SAM-dependent methyltransferase
MRIQRGLRLGEHRQFTVRSSCTRGRPEVDAGRRGDPEPGSSPRCVPPGITRRDVRRGLDHPDGSVQFIYSSHLIEHLARWQALQLLRECRRVLAPGGAVRIATPDLAALIAGYLAGETPAGGTPADSFMASLLTFTERPENAARRVLRRLYTAPHQWLYDEASLSALFREAGFTAPKRRAFRDSALPDLNVLELRDESLFIEARE